MPNVTPVVEMIGSFMPFDLTWVDHCTGVINTKTVYAPDAEWAVWWMRGNLRDKCVLNGRAYRSADYDVSATPAGGGE